MATSSGRGVLGWVVLGGLGLTMMVLSSPPSADDLKAVEAVPSATVDMSMGTLTTCYYELTYARIGKNGQVVETDHVVRAPKKGSCLPEGAVVPIEVDEQDPTVVRILDPAE